MQKVKRKYINIRIHPREVEIYWSSDGLTALDEIVNNLNKNQWDLITQQYRYWLHNKSHDNNFEPSVLPDIQLLKTICQYRVNMLNKHSINLDLLEKYRNFFTYLENISSPVYTFDRSRVYSCILHIIYIAHMQIGKQAKETGYLGSYVIYSVASILGACNDLVAFAFWLTKSIIIAEENDKFGWYENSLIPIQMLIQDVNLDILMVNNDQMSISDTGDVSKQPKCLTLMEVCQQSLKDEWLFSKSVRKIHLKIFLGLCYYLIHNLDNISMEEWLTKLHLGYDTNVIKSIAKNPVLTAMDIIG